MKEFKFIGMEEYACFTCDHVINKERAILFVSHDDDGYWQFLCGSSDHSEENARIISLKEVTELDSSVNDLYELKMNYGARRATKEHKWDIFNF